MTGRHGRPMPRDLALVVLAGTVAGLALLVATVLVATGRAPGSLAITAVGGVVGLAGVALGRLGGPPPTDPPPPPPPA